MKVTICQIFKKIILFLIISVFISGCWNKRELDELGIVGGLGIDLDEKSNQLDMTFQVIKPGEVRSSGGGDQEAGGKGNPVVLYKSKGKSIFEAIRKLANESSRKLYFAHNQVIVISEEAAKKGVRRLLTFFFRDQELRSSMWILICKGKAEDTLKVPGNQEKISSTELADILKVEKSASQSVTIDLQDFVSRLLSKTTAPVAPYFEISQAEGEKLKLTGTAVFDHDKMVGRLSPQESRGLLWITGQVKSGVMTVKVSQSKEWATFEIAQSKTKTKISLKNKQIKVVLNVSTLFFLDEQSGSGDLVTLDNLKKLETLLNRAIKNDIRTTWEKVSLLNVDVFGFGEMIHREYPKKWKIFEPNWNKLFTKIKLEVKSDSRIYNTGQIIKPISPL